MPRAHCPSCGEYMGWDDRKDCCGRCYECCTCGDDFDADELGLDPEDDYDA